MRYLWLLVLAAACDDARERADWQTQCRGAAFTQEQCLFLAAMRDDAADDAAVAQGMSGAAIGFAAGAAASK